MGADTQTIDNVIRLAEMMDKVGVAVVIVAAFLLLFLGIVLYVIRSNAESQRHVMAQQQQMLDILLKRSDDDVKEKESQQPAYNEKEIVAIFCQLNKSLKAECKKFLDETECDRIGIYVFHNGITSSHGLPFFKVSCVCESIKRGSGIGSHIADSTNIPLSVFDDVIQILYSDGIVLIQNDKENAMHSSSFYLEKDKAETAIFTAIYDSMDNVMGFTLGEYRRSLDQEDIDSDHNLYKELCGRLRPVLEFSGYQEYTS